MSKVGRHELISGERVPALGMKCRLKESESKFLGVWRSSKAPFYVLWENGLDGFQKLTWSKSNFD